jgi:hypothetical protein
MAEPPDENPAQRRANGNLAPRQEATDASQAKPPVGARRTWWLGRLLRVMDSLRYAIGVGVMRASALPGHPPSNGEPLHARALLESAKIEEEYFYEQEISQNPHGAMRKPPTGKIVLTLPYDGDKYFTRQAYADITRAHSPAEGDVSALVGHLALNGYARTDLDSRLGLSETYGSIPIQVSVRANPDSGQPDCLIADRWTCVISYDYQPRADQREVIPTTVRITLLDPDSSGWAPQEGETAAGAGEGTITQHVSFRAELLLRMTVELHVSGESEQGPCAKVTRVTLDWPTITSLRSLSLNVNGKHHPVRYNPEWRRLEWADVPMTLSDEQTAGGMHTYTSGTMELSIPQPGELYQEQSLKGSVEVEVDRLLSGMDARLYRATGSIQRLCKPELASHVSANFQLILGDAFARRILSPYQQLHFDEVIPSEMRISDIRTALASRGFAVTDPWPERGPENRWLWARRAEGPDTMLLALYVEGRRHKARRDRRVPGGVTYRSNLDSGEIRIYIRGQLPRDSQPVIHEINALRAALRERFDHLPARR